MRTQRIATIALAGLVAASMWGCGDTGDASTDEVEASTRAQAVTVVPQFSVSGSEEMPEELYLTELGLAISEIRLTPVDGRDTSVAYSSAHPTTLTFDVAHGEKVEVIEPMQLPHPGRYLVSVRLEPTGTTGAPEDGVPSFSVSGFVAGDGVVLIDPRDTGAQSDGSPVPMPFDEDDDDAQMADRPALPKEWTPFHYGSRRSVFFQLNDVEIQEGQQYLSFNFDVHDWALELVDPLLSAMRNVDQPMSEDDDAVDVTTPLESTGHGPEALFENASVHISPGGAPTP